MHGVRSWRVGVCKSEQRGVLTTPATSAGLSSPLGVSVFQCINLQICCNRCTILCRDNADFCDANEKARAVIYSSKLQQLRKASSLPPCKESVEMARPALVLVCCCWRTRRQRAFSARESRLAALMNWDTFMDYFRLNEYIYVGIVKG